MKETKKDKLPILPLFVATLLLCVIFLVQSKPCGENISDHEVHKQSASALPEDKIVDFVFDKVTDVLRLFPQQSLKRFN